MAEEQKKPGRLMSALRKIAKTALIFFAIGFTVAAIAPYFAPIVGISVEKMAELNPKLWTGIFFGLFGGVNAAITPAMEYIFDRKFTKKEKVPLLTQPFCDLENGKCNNHNQEHENGVAKENGVTAAMETSPQPAQENFLKQYAAAKTDEERAQLKTNWEQRLAQRAQDEPVVTR